MSHHVIPTATTLVSQPSCIPLPRYAQIIGVNECSFYGIVTGNEQGYACNEIWTRQQRDNIQRALIQAQEWMETVLGYPLNVRWIANKEDQQLYHKPARTRWGFLHRGGVRAVSIIQAAVPVAYTSDPIVIGPIACAVTSDIEELFLCHPGTEEIIFPSKISYDTTLHTVTFEVPQCRLIKLDHYDNPETGWDYYDIPPSPTSPFTTTVDVLRIYNDPSKQIELHTKAGYTSGTCSCTDSCETLVDTACMRVIETELGIFDFTPASYAGGLWTPKSQCCCSGRPEVMHLFYQAGIEDTHPYHPVLELALVHLAHVIMPSEPCGCEILTRMWKEDTKVPDFLTRERLNCPFGIREGAWQAFQTCLNMRIVGSYTKLAYGDGWVNK